MMLRHSTVNLLFQDQLLNHLLGQKTYSKHIGLSVYGQQKNSIYEVFKKRR